MKALSLWQPWASAIAVGAKHIETRSWSTAYRGPLAIHAAKHFVWAEMDALHRSRTWAGALWPLQWGLHAPAPWEQINAPLQSKLPLGAVVAVCNLVDCRPTSSFTVHELDTRRRHPGMSPIIASLYEWTERQMGDFTLGRFGWVVQDVQMLKAPIPCRGSQGLFDLSPEVCAKVNAMVKG